MTREKAYKVIGSFLPGEKLDTTEKLDALMVAMDALVDCKTVIRCKYCKYFFRPLHICRAKDTMSVFVTPDDYCSRGYKR